MIALHYLGAYEHEVSLMHFGIARRFIRIC